MGGFVFGAGGAAETGVVAVGIHREVKAIDVVLNDAPFGIEGVDHDQLQAQ